MGFVLLVIYDNDEIYSNFIYIFEWLIVSISPTAVTPQASNCVLFNLHKCFNSLFSKNFK